jgi:hypothetical protein
LPSGTQFVRGASIVVDTSLLDSHCPAIQLEEIPIAVEVFHSALFDGKVQPIVSVNETIDLDGALMKMAATATGTGRLRFDIDTTDWDGGITGSPALPQQLWPYMSGRISSHGVPTSGIWQAGQVVWAIPDNNASRELSTTTVGWMCVIGGTPGTWKSFSTDQEESMRK